MIVKRMKIIVLSMLMVLGSCLSAITSHAQDADPKVLAHFRSLIQLILTDNVKELSKRITYPLERQNPLPNINNAEEFIRKYPLLFDSAFKEMLRTYDDSDVFEHNFIYGLVGGKFTGDIWMYEDGTIAGLNYSSSAEQAIRSKLKERLKAVMHSSVREWDENIISARSPKLLIRVDRIGDSYRYACWSNGKTLSDQPDIIINNGKVEQQGTMGGWKWIFKNAGWTYTIDDVELGDDDTDFGYFLELEHKGKLISTTKLELIK